MKAFITVLLLLFSFSVFHKGFTHYDVICIHFEDKKPHLESVSIYDEGTGEVHIKLFPDLSSIKKHSDDATFNTPLIKTVSFFYINKLSKKPSEKLASYTPEFLKTVRLLI